jgi:hypothetical protein
VTSFSAYRWFPEVSTKEGRWHKPTHTPQAGQGTIPPDSTLLSGAEFGDPAPISVGKRATESNGVKIPTASRRAGLLPPGVVQSTTVDRVEAKIVDKAKHRCLGVKRVADDRASYPPLRSAWNTLLKKALGEDVVECLDHGMPDLLRDPLAVKHAPVDRIDAAIAKLRVVVAGIDHDDALLGTFANGSRGRSATAFVGIEMITISTALAASTTETGVAPIAAANSVRLSAPLEFAIEA